jgi:hypothetical protein
MSGLDEAGLSKIEIAPIDNVKEPNFESKLSRFSISGRKQSKICQDWIGG